MLSKDDLQTQISKSEEDIANKELSIRIETLLVNFEKRPSSITPVSDSAIVQDFFEEKALKEDNSIIEADFNELKALEIERLTIKEEYQKLKEENIKKLNDDISRLEINNKSLIFLLENRVISREDSKDIASEQTKLEENQPPHFPGMDL